MKSIYKIFVFATLCICGLTACSDDEEEKEKIFTFAADGTPELIGDNGLDFNAMYETFKGKVLDYSTYTEYKINNDGSLEYIDYYVLTFPHPDKYSEPLYSGSLNDNSNYLTGFPTDGEKLHYWTNEGVFSYWVAYLHGHWIGFQYLNYPLDKQQETIFFKRYYSESLGFIVKFKNGKLGFVNKKEDGWHFYDGVGAYDERYQTEILERYNNYSIDCPYPSPYDPEL